MKRLIDPTFDLDTSIRSDTDHMVDSFCEEWIMQLEQGDRVSLGLLLCFQFSKQLEVGDMRASELAGLMIGKSDRTICEWRMHFLSHDGEIPENKQGMYQRSGVLWTSERLNQKAAKFIREYANKKGEPNLTIGKFCHWVNNDLLPNETLEPGFPRKISVETGRKWMHNMGFKVTAKKKGTYVDGHEREDVVQYGAIFLRCMVSLGFLSASNAPTDEARKALPQDLRALAPEVMEAI